MARKKIKEEVPEPNLVPVMNLVMLLIPFLLMASAFFEVAIINVSAPKVASGPSSDDTPKDDKPKLNLTVVVSDGGFKICAYGGCLAGRRAKVARRTVQAVVSRRWRRPFLARVRR